MTRERELKERRALKQAKKDARKLAAAEGIDTEGNPYGAADGIETEDEENAVSNGEEPAEPSEQ